MSKTWTILDARGNEHTGLREVKHDKTNCNTVTALLPTGEYAEFHGNVLIFEDTIRGTQC